MTIDLTKEQAQFIYSMLISNINIPIPTAKIAHECQVTFKQALEPVKEVA